MDNEHPRHIILDEMKARGWDDDDMTKDMSQQHRVAMLLYLHVEKAEGILPGAGVLDAAADRLGVSRALLDRLDENYRAIAVLMEED